MKFRELMKSLVPWPFRQTGRLKICAYCGLRASAFGFPWPAAMVILGKSFNKMNFTTAKF
ncbi:MAG: hypothetical protein GY782_03100 [Gammaproteobacteria bacterium]|nr:hypothetical protein [Gammaproteobacteria bacterium]